MTKLFAPILAFTCDEIWQAMPHRDGDDGRNVLLNEMNKPFTEYALDEDTMKRWDEIIQLRDLLNAEQEPVGQGHPGSSERGRFLCRNGPGGAGRHPHRLSG